MVCAFNVPSDLCMEDRESALIETVDVLVVWSCLGQVSIQQLQVASPVVFSKVIEVQ